MKRRQLLSSLVVFGSLFSGCQRLLGNSRPVRFKIESAKVYRLTSSGFVAMVNLGRRSNQNEETTVHLRWEVKFEQEGFKRAVEQKFIFPPDQVDLNAALVHSGLEQYELSDIETSRVKIILRGEGNTDWISAPPAQPA